MLPPAESMDFKEIAARIKPSRGEMALAWLGQSGFWIKNSFGEVLVIDPYLSDLAERVFHLKRLNQNVVEPENLIADVVLVTHEHVDHLDMDSLPAILAGTAEMYCCRKSEKLCREAGFDMSRIHAMSIGDRQIFKHFDIMAVYVDHGDSSPEALAYVVETEGVAIYFSADTGYRSEKIQYIADRKIDILVVSINGEFGNMNERDAALMAAQVKPRITIPCHFWTLARHRGNPYDFELAMAALAPDCLAYTMRHGESIIFSAEKGLIAK